MWIVVEGIGELIYNEKSYEVKAGDAVYFEPFHTHQIRNNSGQSLKVLSFWWQKQCST
jgi:mannose-6-phosphate isomerase-like protein (cupin superfamily)